MSTDVLGYPCVSLFYDTGNVLLDEWLTMLSDIDDFAYSITRQTGDNYSVVQTQEWIRCEGDSSINIVNIININFDGKDSLVKIYFDEKMVGQFDHNAGQLFSYGKRLNNVPSLEDIRSNIMSFIERWNIGV